LAPFSEFRDLTVRPPKPEQKRGIFPETVRITKNEIGDIGKTGRTAYSREKQIATRRQRYMSDFRPV
jgi:hypothetical protein